MLYKALKEARAMEEQEQAHTGGRFQKGVSGNPAGRRKGIPNKVSRKVIERIAEHGNELLDVVVAKALDGDAAALKLCLERLCPPQKELPLPSIKLPEIAGPEDLPKATEALMQAAASGSMTPSALAAMTAVVRAHVEAVQTADLAERIRKLEGGER